MDTSDRDKVTVDIDDLFRMLHRANYSTIPTTGDDIRAMSRICRALLSANISSGEISERIAPVPARASNAR